MLFCLGYRKTYYYSVSVIILIGIVSIVIHADTPSMQALQDGPGTEQLNTYIHNMHDSHTKLTKLHWKLFILILYCIIIFTLSHVFFLDMLCLSTTYVQQISAYDQLLDSVTP